MKRILVLTFLFSVVAKAQNNDIFDTIAKESCSCVQGKNLDYSKKSDLKDVQISAGLCIVESYANHKSEIPQNEIAGFEGTGGMRRLGEKVAMKMVSFCPDIIMAMGRKYLDENEQNESEEIIGDTLDVYPTITGNITSIETNQFVTVKVKDKNGRNHSFLLLNYFETASLFTDNKLKKGVEITVGYDEIELYDPVSKDFKYFKIITSFEIK